MLRSFVQVQRLLLLTGKYIAMILNGDTLRFITINKSKIFAKIVLVSNELANKFL